MFYNGAGHCGISDQAWHTLCVCFYHCVLFSYNKKVSLQHLCCSFQQLQLHLCTSPWINEPLMLKGVNGTSPAMTVYLNGLFARPPALLWWAVFLVTESPSWIMHKSAGPYDKCIAASSWNRSQTASCRARLGHRAATWIKLTEVWGSKWRTLSEHSISCLALAEPPATVNTHFSVMTGRGHLIMTGPTRRSWIWSTNTLCP